jgi:hypothetical protein
MRIPLSWNRSSWFNKLRLNEQKRTDQQRRYQQKEVREVCFMENFCPKLEATQRHFDHTLEPRNFTSQKTGSGADCDHAGLFAGICFGRHHLWPPMGSGLVSECSEDQHDSEEHLPGVCRVAALLGGISFPDSERATLLIHVWALSWCQPSHGAIAENAGRPDQPEIPFA